MPISELQSDKNRHPSHSIVPQVPTEANPVASAELSNVRDFIAILQMALKNYSLYPETHSVTQNVLTKVTATLVDFLNQYGILRIVVTPDGLLYKEHPIHEGSYKIDPLVGPLFRDGILWIEFQKGVQKQELALFLTIITQYKTLNDEPEADLVTALWKEDLHHVTYRAVEPFWDQEPHFDFSHFSLSAEDGATEADDSADASATDASCSGSEGHGRGAAIQIESNPLNPDIFVLSPEESHQLHQMVDEEEQHHDTEDALDILVILLGTQETEPDFSAVLEILQEELFQTIATGAFQLVVNVLKRLIHLARNPETPRWCTNVLKVFFKQLSAPEGVAQIQPALCLIQKADNEVRRALRQYLTMLPPGAIAGLAQLLPDTPGGFVRQVVLEAIGILAQRDVQPLKTAMQSSSETVTCQLLSILSQTNNPATIQILHQMTHHASAMVRQLALQHLLRQDPQAAAKLFFLIEDPDPAVRHALLDRLEKTSDGRIEILLRDYLIQHQDHRGDAEQLDACYSALGRCGTEQSVDFLAAQIKNISLKNLFGFKGSALRRCAAKALSQIGGPASRKILTSAAASWLPGIRLAARGALKATPLQKNTE